jgi:hypothetical protein
VVYRSRKLLEELPQGDRVKGIEGGAAQRSAFARGALRAFSVAPGQDHIGPGGAGMPGYFEPDTGAAAYEDHGLVQQLRYAFDGRGASCRAHRDSGVSSTSGPAHWRILPPP